MEVNTPMNSGAYDDLFRDIFNYPDYLMGNFQAEEPAIVEFLNGYTAACILSKHIQSQSKIAIHTDVDMDGIGSCYVFKNWMKQVAPLCDVDCYINTLKVHGVEDIQINHFNTYSSNNKNYDLVIILDSATNNVNYIKKLNCDCIVIDHHEISIDMNEMAGQTAGGNYVIVNSMASNGNVYIGNDFMSAGLTVYEFLRYYQYGMGMKNYLADLKLYQWAVITLFTDCINNDNLRNIYYIQKARADIQKEPGLAQMLESVDCFSMTLNKSDIGFTLGPLFNRAIRAGYSGVALQLALTQPKKVKDLLYFKEVQDAQVKDFEIGAIIHENPSKYVTKDITNTGTSPNYAGLVAMKLLDKYSATSIVYRDIGDGLVGGSFRGATDVVDYRKIIVDMGYYAQGHKSAFGFKFPKDKIDEIMSTLVSYEKNGLVKDYLTAGYINPRGTHHIDDIIDFQRNGGFWKLGTINSMMATNINIVISSSELDYVSVNAKHTFFTYSFNGIELRAFEEIVTSQAYIYVEFQDNLRIYVKNKWM